MRKKHKTTWLYNYVTRVAIQPMSFLDFVTDVVCEGKYFNKLRKVLVMPKTVLVVSYFAPPLINAESILVWKTLSEMSSNFDTNVLTATLPRSARVDPCMTLPSNVRILRTPTFKPASRVLSKLVDKVLGMGFDEQYLWATFAPLEDVNYDLIYSRSHPGASHILAYKHKHRTGKPWIAQFSDPWTNNPYHSNHTRFRKAFDTRWEEKVVRHADFLIFPTKEILELFHEEYPDLNIRSKSAVLPHHYLPDLYNRQNLRTETDTFSSISISYFGDFYGVRSPEPLIKALEQLSHSNPALLSNVELNFYGNIESRFTAMIDSSPVTINRGKVTYFESLTLMNKSDVLLLIDAPSKSGVNPFLASKLVDYLGAGKRILGITDLQGTSADILRKHGHYVVNPHDTTGIISALQECITSPLMPVEPPTEFMTKNVVGQLARIMNQLSDSTKDRRNITLRLSD